MTKGSDDLTLTFYETELTITSSKSLNTENKILNPIWMLGQNNTRLTLYLGEESKYHQILTLY